MKKEKKRCELDSILNLLKKDFTKAQIRDKLGIKPTALSNHLRRLEEKGYIERKGKFIIEVLPSSHSHPRVTINQVNKKLNKRGHAYNFKVIFPMETEGLRDKKEVKNEVLKNKLERLSFGSLKFKHKRNTIWINKNSITIYSNNSYYSDNALHSKFKALKEVDNLVKYLKNRFNLKGVYGIEVFREHYGLIFNKFAKWTLKRGEKLDIKDNGNKSILWVDDSRKDDIGLNEFEGKDPLKINNADKFFESCERTDWRVTPEFTLDALNKTADLVGKNAAHLNYHAENMRSHVEAIRTLSETVKELRDEIKSIRGKSI